VLSVALQVPCHDEKAAIGVIYDEQLNQVLDASGKDVLNPNFSSWGNIKVE